MLKNRQGFAGGWVVNTLPATSGDAKDYRVQSLDLDDPLETEMTSHSSILA